MADRQLILHLATLLEILNKLEKFLLRHKNVIEINYGLSYYK